MAQKHQGEAGAAGHLEMGGDGLMEGGIARWVL